MLERMVFSGPMFFMTACSLALMTVFCSICERKRNRVRQGLLAALLFLLILRMLPLRWRRCCIFWEPFFLERQYTKSRAGRRFTARCWCIW